MTTGFLLGKFMPLHRGHQYLIEEAQRRVDRLTVLVCSVRSQPIPGEMRYAWVRDLYPAVDVQHCSDEIPQYPSEAPDEDTFWRIWIPVVRRYLPTGPDFVFTSESYGDDLAARLGARHVCIDPGRRVFPVSGSKVRESPAACWHYLPPPVQNYYRAQSSPAAGQG